MGPAGCSVWSSHKTHQGCALLLLKIFCGNLSAIDMVQCCECFRESSLPETDDKRSHSLWNQCHLNSQILQDIDHLVLRILDFVDSHVSVINLRNMSLLLGYYPHCGWGFAWWQGPCNWWAHIHAGQRPCHANEIRQTQMVRKMGNRMDITVILVQNYIL